MHTDTSPVLVTGATGQQGGATARALRAVGVPVRALVRDPTTRAARRVESLGAELVVGDLGDRGSLRRAVQGTRAVFSVQMPPMNGQGVDFDAEITQGFNLIEGALDASVPQFVHTSLTGAGQHVEVDGWSEGRWVFMEPAYGAKTAIQERVKTAGFAHWTLLKPGFFMENFLPSAAYLFPRGIENGLISVLRPETRLSLTAVDDIGTAAATAIAEPDRFNAVVLELASDYLSMAEVAATLSRVLDVELKAPDMIMDDALAAGMPPMGASGLWLNAAGQPARPRFARDLGLPLTSFEAWAQTHMPAPSSLTSH